MRLASSDQGFWLLTGQCTRVIGGQRTTFPGSQGHVFPLYLRVRKAKASSVGSLYKCEPPPAFLPTEPPLSPFVYLVLWMQALGFNVFGGICDATQAKYNHGAAQSHAWGWHLLGIHNSETHRFIPVPQGPDSPRKVLPGVCQLLVNMAQTQHIRQWTVHTGEGHLVLWKLANQPEVWEALFSTVNPRPSGCPGFPIYRMAVIEMAATMENSMEAP